MKIKGFFKKLGSGSKKVAKPKTQMEPQVATEPVQEEQQKVSKQELAWQRDPYGFGIMRFCFDASSIGWKEDDSFGKNVILVNPKELEENRITVNRLSSLFSGTGKSAWEMLTAYVILYSCKDALDKGEKEADITLACVRNFYCTADERTCSAEKIRTIFFNCCEVVSENDEEMRVRFRFTTK